LISEQLSSFRTEDGAVIIDTPADTLVPALLSLR